MAPAAMLLKFKMASDAIASYIQQTSVTSLIGIISQVEIDQFLWENIYLHER